MNQDKGTIRKLIKAIEKEYQSCNLCPHKCGVNRLNNEFGKCGIGRNSRMFNTTMLVNENEEIAPTYAIYFAGCSLACRFCSVAKENALAKTHTQSEIKVSDPKIEKQFLLLNADDDLITKIKNEISLLKPKTISFIGGEPSVHLLTILELIERLQSRTPLVFYTNLYFNPRIAKIVYELLDLSSSVSFPPMEGASMRGYVVADMHYGDDECARIIANSTNGYFKTVTKNAIMLSNRLILRHLLLPGHIDCCYKKIIDWMALNLPDKPLYLLTNYFAYLSRQISNIQKNADEIAKIDSLKRRLYDDEIKKAIDYAENKGIITKILNLLKPRPDMKEPTTQNQEIMIDEDGTVAFKYLDGVTLELASYLLNQVQNEKGR